MQPVEITCFSATLFLSLAVLIKWKRRRDVITARLNRGLRGYVATKGKASVRQPAATPGESLITA
jgi:hypothetical protein